MRILLVEDEDSIREVQKLYLEQAGYIVDEARDGKEALTYFSKYTYSLIILDLHLPIVDGTDVAKKVREKSTVPIIMVTARTNEADELIGLNLGADDYVKKPFSPKVLIARVKNLLKRNGESEIIKAGKLTIDPEKMVIKKGKELIELTTTQFNILYTLAKRKGKVFTRAEILDYAYDATVANDVFDRTIDAHIKSIRKKVEDDTKEPKYVLTVIGKGYKFNDGI